MNKVYAISSHADFNLIHEDEGVYSTRDEALKRCRDLAEAMKSHLELRGKEVRIEEKNGEVWVYYEIGSKIYSALYRVIGLEVH